MSRGAVRRALNPSLPLPLTPHPHPSPSPSPSPLTFHPHPNPNPDPNPHQVPPAVHCGPAGATPLPPGGPAQGKSVSK